MTPKEKAKELVDKFMLRIIFNIKQEIKNSVIEAAKECALLSVDEIIYSYPTDPFNILQPTGIKVLDYWRKVKEEIQKL